MESHAEKTSSIEPPPISEERERLEHDFGLSGVEELKHLREAVESRTAFAKEHPEDAPAAQELRIAEKELRLFYAEHDSAGAFKFYKFGREMQGWFSGDQEKSAIIRRDEEGSFALEDGQQNRHLIFVDVGELDRFNKEGGQAMGDEALAATTHLIEQKVHQALAQQPDRDVGYEVFRFGFSSFMVSVESAENVDFAQLTKDLNEKRPEVEGASEPVPLTAVDFPLQKGLDLLNEAQIETYPLNDREAARQAISLMRKLADHRLESAKFVSRVNRVLEVMDARAPEEAEAFYRTYLQKHVSHKGFDSLDKFSEFNGLPDEEKKTRLAKLAREAANQRLELDDDHEEVEQNIILAHRNEMSCLSMLPAALSAGDAKLAAIPKLTAGQRGMAGVRLDLENVMARLGSGERSADLREARLDCELSLARRDAGTGLLTRGAYYETLQSDLEHGLQPTLVFADLGFLKYFDAKGGRVVGNNATKLMTHLTEQAVEAVARENGGKETDVEIYRYGGDEFAILVREGGVQAADRIVKKLGELRDQAGAVPAGPRSSDEYGPTELVINVGVCERRTLEAVMSDLIEANAVDSDILNNPQALLNFKAEVMTHAADLGMEEEKCVGRFLQMVDELRSPAATNGHVRRQIEARLEASGKTLLDDMGGRRFLETMVARRDLDGKALEKEVRRYVAETLKAKHEASASRQEIRNRLVEAHARIQNLELEIGELEKETHRLRQVVGEQAEEIGGLRERTRLLEEKLKQAREETRRIVEEAVRG